MQRRGFLGATAGAAFVAAADPLPGMSTFQIACMTLPYSEFPFGRALAGIRNTGYRFVAWGVQHEKKPLLDAAAPSAEAASLARVCRDSGLEPVMMFSTIHLEAKDALEGHLRRLDQAAAAKIPFLLTFGRTEKGEYANVIRALKGMAAHARSAGVTVVIKQHGGNSATGADCARILADVGEDAIKICYDAGNVLDYENHDPIADIRTCWREIRAFAIKDHRNTPRDEDCGPGFGEIDHYKLLTPIMQAGRTIPLACENIFEPLVPRPATPEQVDALARRAREYLETVLRGLRHHTGNQQA
jgi:sugar phosphate isomerase/epimerase